jgi:hypothetical protein
LVWFQCPDADVIVNLADCCNALGLIPALVQRAVLPLISAAACLRAP